MPGAGVEPARPNGHMALNHACLPIPAPGLSLVNHFVDALTFVYLQGTFSSSAAKLHYFVDASKATVRFQAHFCASVVKKVMQK